MCKMGGYQKFRRPKLALIGSGAIGGTMGLLAGLKELGDTVLFDVVKGMPDGKALDLTHTCPIVGSSCNFAGTNSFESIKDADVVIVTAGLTKVPGKPDGEWARDDLLPFNAEVMRSVGYGIKQYCPNAFIICITNPLDCMVKVLQEESGVDTNMICGMAGVLDSARFRRFIADKLQVSPGDVQGTVIGAHGSDMVPLPRYCTVNGISINEFIEEGWLTQKDVDDIVVRTREGGKEIVNLLGQGSAFYAPSCAAIEMATSYLRDEKRVLPCAVCLNGQYGVKDLYVGVPCVIGSGGIERIIEMKLNKEENEVFQASVRQVQALAKKLEEMEVSKKKISDQEKPVADENRKEVRGTRG